MNDPIYDKIPSKKDWLSLVVPLGTLLIAFFFVGLEIIWWTWTTIDNTPLLIAYFLIPFIIFIWLVLKLSAFKNKLWKHSWKSHASILGWQFLNEETPPELQGVYQGYPVHIQGIENLSGHGKYRRTTIYTKITLDLRNNNEEFLRLSASGQTLFENPGFRIGDRKFDKQWNVFAHSIDFAKATLSSASLRQRLLDLRTLRTNIYIEGNSLAFQETGYMTNEARLKAILNILIALVSAFEKSINLTEFDHPFSEREEQKVPKIPPLTPSEIKSIEKHFSPENYEEAKRLLGTVAHTGYRKQMAKIADGDITFLKKLTNLPKELDDFREVSMYLSAYRKEQKRKKR